MALINKAPRKLACANDIQIDTSEWVAVKPRDNLSAVRSRSKTFGNLVINGEVGAGFNNSCFLRCRLKNLLLLAFKYENSQPEQAGIKKD